MESIPMENNTNPNRLDKFGPMIFLKKFTQKKHEKPQTKMQIKGSNLSPRSLITKLIALSKYEDQSKQAIPHWPKLVNRVSVLHEHHQRWK